MDVYLRVYSYWPSMISVSTRWMVPKEDAQGVVGGLQYDRELIHHPTDIVHVHDFCISPEMQSYFNCFCQRSTEPLQARWRGVWPVCV